MLGQGHTLNLLDEAREVGRHQHPGPENQDSQHMIDQPGGSFPDLRRFRDSCRLREGHPVANHRFGKPLV